MGIRHIPGTDNAAADALSRSTNVIMCHTTPDYAAITQAQTEDEGLRELQQGTTSLRLVLQQTERLATPLWCDISMWHARPYIPEAFRHFHDMAHPGILATQRLIQKQAVWPGMKRDHNSWVQTCIPCQTAKIHWHIKLPLHQIPTPTQRFHTVHIDIVGPLPPLLGVPLPPHLH
ncbi:uncharacterized protein LOC143028552 [Oratosquilla oratoria]|uniref:uncharacterized protein LOC143028552 n=1 Tax=Oratosquilla oratoria TaxID=337810 RepID=UPI003F77827D